MRRALLVLIGILAFALYGCSSGRSNAHPSGEATTHVPSGYLPKCADVWVAGKKLPTTYQGCVNADGSLEASTPVHCTSAMKLDGYDDRYWALVPRGLIKDSGKSNGVTDDPDYLRDLQACMADI